MRRLQGVESQWNPFEVLTEAPGGVELIRQSVLVPRVIDAQAPSELAAAITEAALTNARIDIPPEPLSGSCRSTWAERV